MNYRLMLSLVFSVMLWVGMLILILPTRKTYDSDDMIFISLVAGVYFYLALAFGFLLFVL